MDCLRINNQTDKPEPLPPKELVTKQPTQSKSTSTAKTKNTNKIVWYMGDEILNFDFRQN